MVKVLGVVGDRSSAVAGRDGETGAMSTVDRDGTPIDLHRHEDGVLDTRIASMTPDEFDPLRERSGRLSERADVLRESAEVLGRLGR
jgi:hypothetical protein